MGGVEFLEEQLHPLVEPREEPEDDAEPEDGNGSLEDLNDVSLDDQTEESFEDGSIHEVTKESFQDMLDRFTHCLFNNYTHCHIHII